MNFDVIIVGGGLAGLTSAVHLSKKGLLVLLIEKQTYPKHKVCGEYISNEVLPYLKALGFNPFHFGAKNITQFTLSTRKSQTVSTSLPSGGFGISRYCIDAELAKIAAQNGAQILQATVSDVNYGEDGFKVFTTDKDEFTAELVIGAFGKRSNLDVKMDRAFMKRPSPFLGIKAHYKGELPDNAMKLHNFKGGYCGISKVENDLINVCYIANYKAFKKYKNITDFQEQVLSENKYLKTVFEKYDLIFEKPLSISQVSFSAKQPVENHIIMCGDSAGMIHPLAGNGMSMAIRGAQMACDQILKYKSGVIKSRAELEVGYTKRWNKEFSARLKSGHIIARLFRLGLLSELLMLFIKAFPFLLSGIIKKTHGKPMKAEL